MRDGRSERLFELLLLMSRAWNVDSTLVWHGIRKPIAEAGASSSRLYTRDPTTQTPQTLQSDAEGTTLDSARSMRQIRSLSINSTILQQPRGLVPDDHNEGPLVILSSQRCVMAALATAWRQHIDDTGQVHAVRLPSKFAAVRRIWDVGLRVLRPFWLHLIISPAGATFHSSNPPMSRHGSRPHPKHHVAHITFSPL
jgi:hypothetical protein